MRLPGGGRIVNKHASIQGGDTSLNNTRPHPWSEKEMIRFFLTRRILLDKLSTLEGNSSLGISILHGSPLPWERRRILSRCDGGGTRRRVLPNDTTHGFCTAAIRQHLGPGCKTLTSCTLDLIMWLGGGGGVKTRMPRGVKCATKGNCLCVISVVCNCRVLETVSAF